jgi:hypothetical protein
VPECGAVSVGGGRRLTEGLPEPLKDGDFVMIRGVAVSEGALAVAQEVTLVVGRGAERVTVWVVVGLRELPGELTLGEGLPLPLPLAQGEALPERDGEPEAELQGLAGGERVRESEQEGEPVGDREKGRAARGAGAAAGRRRGSGGACARMRTSAWARRSPRRRARARG